MRLLMFVFLCFFIISCTNRNNAPDVSHIKVDIPIKRFEQSFFTIDTSNIEGGLSILNSQFPQFFPLFANRILRLPYQPGERISDPGITDAFRQIITSYRPINDSIQLKYRNLDDIKKELDKAYAYVKHYFPDYKIPEAISFIGTFDAPGIVLTPEFLGIGLHQFAGKNFSVYQDPQLLEVYPSYISKRFDREYITVSCMQAVADDVYPDSSQGRPLIEQMIEKGKQWLLAEHFLPDAPDSIITGYSKKQVEWVESNEGNIWGFINSNNDIYTIDPSVIQDYIGEAPFTRGMPEGFAPGNIGQWVGWRIIKKYMEREPEQTLQQVLTTPAKEIFQRSRYKPK
jgi:hypothetical protein